MRIESTCIPKCYIWNLVCIHTHTHACMYVYIYIYHDCHDTDGAPTMLQTHLRHFPHCD